MAIVEVKRDRRMKPIDLNAVGFRLVFHPGLGNELKTEESFLMLKIESGHQFKIPKLNPEDYQIQNDITFGFMQHRKFEGHSVLDVCSRLTDKARATYGKEFH